MIRILVVTTVLASSLSSSAALAQSETPRPEARRTVIDMDADVIEGTLKTPDHVVFQGNKPTKFRSLIEIRKEFRREVLASAAQL